MSLLHRSSCCQTLGAPVLRGCYHGCIAMAHERIYIATEDKPVLIGSKDDPVPEGIKVAWQMVVDLNQTWIPPVSKSPTICHSKTKTCGCKAFWALGFGESFSQTNGN